MKKKYNQKGIITLKEKMANGLYKATINLDPVFPDSYYLIIVQGPMPGLVITNKTVFGFDLVGNKGEYKWMAYYE